MSVLDGKAVKASRFVHARLSDSSFGDGCNVKAIARRARKRLEMNHADESAWCSK